jgi:DNA-binding HxlR family transcriptional regulator
MTPKPLTTPTPGDMHDADDADDAIDKMRDCPVMTTVEIMGGRWKPRILWHLRSRAASFAELQRATQASERMLSKSLRELEAHHVITRTVVPVGKVVTTRYAFSEYGLTLAPVLDAMGHWGLRHQRTQVQVKPTAESQRDAA